jgi:hypothetical protein
MHIDFEDRNGSLILLGDVVRWASKGGFNGVREGTVIGLLLDGLNCDKPHGKLKICTGYSYYPYQTMTYLTRSDRAVIIGRAI